MGFQDWTQIDDEYLGVSTRHPSIVSSIRNLAEQGHDDLYIQKIVGQPLEVVRMHARPIRAKQAKAEKS